MRGKSQTHLKLGLVFPYSYFPLFGDSKSIGGVEGFAILWHFTWVFCHFSAERTTSAIAAAEVSVSFSVASQVASAPQEHLKEIFIFFLLCGKSQDSRSSSAGSCSSHPPKHSHRCPFQYLPPSSMAARRVEQVMCVHTHGRPSSWACGRTPVLR